MTSERQAFLDAIAAAPDDVAARNAFSDWLRDRGEEPPGGEVRAFAYARLREAVRRKVEALGVEFVASAGAAETGDPAAAAEA